MHRIMTTIQIAVGRERRIAVTVIPITLMPNQDKNSEMNRTIVATPAIRSASDQRAALKLYAGTEDAAAAAAGAGGAVAGAGALTAGAAWVAVASALSEAPQLGQALASSAATFWH